MSAPHGADSTNKTNIYYLHVGPNSLANKSYKLIPDSLWSCRNGEQYPGQDNTTSKMGHIQ